MEVPRVDDHASRVRVLHQNGDVFVVGLRLREAVVEHDVDGILDRLVVSISATTTRSR